MDYDRIILEMLDRIKVLEEDVAKLKADCNSTFSSTDAVSENPSTGKKYRALTDYFANTATDQIRLSFAEIERILGFKLPSSAREHRAFWANTTTHSIALSWLKCGFETELVDMNAEEVVFGRKRGTRIDDLMQKLVDGIVAEHGEEYELTSYEIKQMMKDRFDIPFGSSIPSDYCYNRVNAGINIYTKPKLFEYIPETKLYKCLGRCPYNGDIYHRPKGEKEDIIVGICKNGEREIFPEYRDSLNCALPED